ncbi:uncharacterized protein LOC104421595 isoform X1 [Eucalyptus grandis]|uniref:uncharacterized protein LOC104421595 isoform X1 n=1 Tax=Eucalyptus grandis TaxID=71139 RepID=UPI00192F0E2B|nr:uncharacterized protein LOC104421595 isoform X1 [Eucalyptus grandis]XP_039159544.1 uncharacterized protein LOC104421595 isoform X1 [Eucalyptus grandis]
MMPPRFSIFGGGGGGGGDAKKPGGSPHRAPKSELASPSIKLRTDKEVYRPGDAVVATVEIVTPDAGGVVKNGSVCSLLIKRLGFEIRGIEKLDSQWFATQKPSPESRQRRGEYAFMDCSVPSIFSNQIVSCGTTKTYVIRAVLPSIIPPSYRGATIRYLYYIKTMLSGQWQILETGHSQRESAKDLPELEVRVPLQVWVDQKNSGLLLDEGQSEGIVPLSTIQLDIYWKEMDGESDWVRANDIYDGVEEGYDSSRDEISSVSSYNPSRENIHRTFGSSLSLQSSIARSSSRDISYAEGERMSLSSNMAIPRLSAAEILHDNDDAHTSGVASPNDRSKLGKSLSTDNHEGAFTPDAEEGFIRARSYNIRMDDRVLLRFSPKNSDSTYYFSDTIGGTLTFFPEEGARRCLEVSITLEMSETINRRFVHPSRKNSPTITKVQSDHHEVVADLVQTSFLFSIPMDGPMSFSTPRISVQWALRFEFYTTPKNVDWTRYEHPLLVEGREKSEWVLPIIVHAPPPGPSAAPTRSEKYFSLEPLWGS